MLTNVNVKDMEVFKEYLESRSSEMNASIILNVSEILEDVKINKDEAIKRYTKQFDGITCTELRVSKEEIQQCASKADAYFVECLKKAADNIACFHKKQKQTGYEIKKEMGIYLGQRVLPLDSVGIYVPGGRAQYPSSVLMNAIPAKIAGVKRIVMVTPPSFDGELHPNIAVAAMVAGVDEIYKIGGAQAIGALAYGSESIDKVDKIVGPGNIYVATAKKLVFGVVDIDMIAGPSEILVIADEHANPKYVAADLLSQAEHDPLASSILVSVSASLISKVNEELKKQTALLPKKNIAEASLKNYGKSILCDSIDACIEVSNAIAPEHLELMVEDAKSYLHEVKHAGSVFLGYHSCESVGDYYGGSNHVLPTNGTARFSSALSVDSFIKKSSYLYYSKEALETYGNDIMEMAQQEELQAHANAVRVRIQK